MKIRYIVKRFNRSSMLLIGHANDIIEKYQDDGYDLTLRQLYYQFVSRDLLANTIKNYKRLGSVINDARLAGLIDWTSLVDRTRNLKSMPHWLDPAEIIESSALSYAIDMWANQDYRPEVWIEKDALLGVIQKVCRENQVPYFSCRGYTSQSEMWGASQRMKKHIKAGQDPIVIHLGDHDPSGVDMSRDIADRLQTVFRTRVRFVRIALNMPQVRKYNLPPNPAKLSDSRAEKYIAEFGPNSWELDALEPQVMNDMIQKRIDVIKDPGFWKEDLAIQEKDREDLEAVSDNWPTVVNFVNENC
jgi:hypothetical protein